MVKGHLRCTMPCVVLLTALALSACGNFDNPLRWEPSPLSDDLVGSWKTAEGGEAFVARVARTDTQALSFELVFASDRRETFLADFVASESVHVLQVRMDTYQEFKASGEPDNSFDGRGFQFRRVTLSPEVGSLSVQEPDADVMGRVAEAEFAGSGLEINATTAAGCIGEDLFAGALAGIWAHVSDAMDDDLEADVIAALWDKPRDEFERELTQARDARVDFYKELDDMRECIVKHLPSEALEQLFLLHADQVFSGDVERLVRE